MPEIILKPGESEKIVSQPARGEAYNVRVSGTDVFLSHNSKAIIREGKHVVADDRVKLDNLGGKSIYAKNPNENTGDAAIDISRAAFNIVFNPRFAVDSSIDEVRDDVTIDAVNDDLVVNSVDQLKVLDAVKDDSGTDVPAATSDPANPDPRAIQVVPSEGVDRASKPKGADIAPGGTETATFTPPAGELWEIQTMAFFASYVSGGSSGTHEISVRAPGSLKLIEGISQHSEDVQYKTGEWRSANQDQYPADPTTQHNIVNGIRISPGDSLTMKYINNTDATQDIGRTYNLHYRTIQV